MKTDPKEYIVRNSKYFIYIAIAYVAVLIISDTVAIKVVSIGPFAITAALFVFPISYIFGDILTEVYGYKASRKVIWSGMFGLIFMALTYWFVQALPPASFWEGQKAFEATLGLVPRIVIVGIVAILMGEFSNSFVLSKMKVLMNGKNLWMRTIGSTVVGEAVDTIVFYPLAFWGVIPFSGIIILMYSGYLFKVAYEVLATPITYKIINWLKRKEGIDIYDRGISYNPFHLSERK
jgi:queuosine precursor transporter